VVHGMDGALELEIVEVEELGDEDVRIEPLEEPDAPQTPADAERADPRRPLVQSGIGRVRRHVADRLAQLGGQMPDEVSPVVPVLTALGVEDDPAVAARQAPERAILPPAPEEPPGHRRVVPPCRWETSSRSTPGADVTVDRFPGRLHLILQPWLPATKE